MTKTYHRPASLLVAARQNLAQDLEMLTEVSIQKIKPHYGVARECKTLEGRVPTPEEGLAALHDILAASEAERAAGLRLAASLRMAGVASREIARAYGVSESQLSRMLSAYPEAGVTKASDVVFDDKAGRWTMHSAASIVS